MQSPQSFHSACSDASEEIDQASQNSQEEKDSSNNHQISEIRTAETEESEGEEQQHQQRCFAFRHLIKYLCSEDGKELAACGAISLVFLASSYLLDDPMERPIPYQFIEATGTYVLNLSHNLDSDGDTVPDWIIAVLAVVVCPCLQMLLSWFVGARKDLHRTMCVYLLSLSLTDVSMWDLKSYMGILRPDYCHLSQPNETYEYCTGESKNGDFEFGGSFPSGHASFTFCGLTLLYL